MGLFTWKKKSSSVKAGEDRNKKRVDAKSAKVSDDKKVVKDEKKEPEKKQSMKELYGEGKTKAIKTVSGKKDATTSQSDSGQAAQGKKAKQYGNAYRVLVKPLVTEKAANLGALNKYVFAVAPRANKIEIAKAINEVYGIKPESINIIKVKGKNVRQGRRTGKRKDWKKAVITLPQGKSINIYEGV